MKRLRYDQGAVDEFAEAAERYAAADPRVARRFVENVVLAVKSVHRAPHEWPLAPNVPKALGVRRRLVDAFPFSVVYAENETEVAILAIAHGRRRPGYWRRRLADDR